MINGYLASTSKSSSPAIQVGDPSWKDYEVNVDAYLTNGWDVFAVGVRITEGTGLWFAFSPASHENLGLCTGTECATLADSTIWTGPSSLPATVPVRITIKDNLYSSYVGGNKIFTVTNDDPKTGKVGLSVNCWGQSSACGFRNFKVTRLD